MKNLSVSRLGFCFAVVTIWACGGKSEAPKIPLNPAQSGATTTSGSVSAGAMPPGAQMALDSGNMLYRAKAYDQALAQYRRSAELAPNESAPLVGIFMVADVTKNKKLADSTLARMKALNPDAAATAAGMSQAEIRDIHSGMKTTVPPASAKKE